MFYSPIFELYKKHERFINDFPVFIAIYLVGYLIDISIYTGLDYNFPPLMLTVFGILHGTAYFIVKSAGLRKHFSAFSHSLLYSLLMAIASFIAYMLFFRPLKLPPSGLWGIF